MDTWIEWQEYLIELEEYLMECNINLIDNKNGYS